MSLKYLDDTTNIKLQIFVAINFFYKAQVQKLKNYKYFCVNSWRKEWFKNYLFFENIIIPWLMYSKWNILGEKSITTISKYLYFGIANVGMHEG